MNTKPLSKAWHKLPDTATFEIALIRTRCLRPDDCKLIQEYLNLREIRVLGIIDVKGAYDDT